MKHKLIHTPDHLLVFDDSKIKKGNYRVCIQRGYVKLVDDDPKYYNHRGDVFKKVIAHLPLNDSPILEWVDLLPPLKQEDDVDELAKEYGENIGNKNGTAAFDYKRGYNKAKEKYKYTEEDMRNAIITTRQRTEIVGSVDVESIIQSLSQPKMPTHFQTDTEVNCDGNDNDGCFLDSCGHNCGCVTPKTTTNSQGQIVWVGKYIY